MIGKCLAAATSVIVGLLQYVWICTVPKEMRFQLPEEDGGKGNDGRMIGKCLAAATIIGQVLGIELKSRALSLGSVILLSISFGKDYWNIFIINRQKRPKPGGGSMV